MGKKSQGEALEMLKRLVAEIEAVDEERLTRAQRAFKRLSHGRQTMIILRWGNIVDWFEERQRIVREKRKLNRELYMIQRRIKALEEGEEEAS